MVDPAGRRVTVSPGSDADTVADLRAALGLRGAAGLSVDGEPVSDARRLVDIAALRWGARLGPRPLILPAGRDEHIVPVVEVAVLAGPSCRAWTALRPGRHTVGRSAHCDLRLGDPLVELHHGVFDVGAAGEVRFTQLTGRVPARLDDRPCDAGEVIGPDAVLEIGSSVLSVRPITATRRAESPGGSIVEGPDPWRRLVRRGPPDDADWVAPPIEAPDPPAAHPSPPLTGLIGAAVAGAGALVVASVMGQMMFAVFALVGAAASFTTWAVGVATATRRRRRERRDHAERVDRFRVAVEAASASWRAYEARRHRTTVEALDEVACLGGRIWERRPGEGGQVRLTVGIGSTVWRPPVDGHTTLGPDLAAILEQHAVADRQPAPSRLEPGDGLAVHGERGAARASLRSFVVQLATWIGPADWQLLVVTREPERWEWAGWLPHAVRADGSLGVVAPDEVEAAALQLAGDRITVVVADDASLFDARTGPTRRLVAARRAIVLVAVSREQSAPSICERILRLGSTGFADWTGDPQDGGFPSSVRVCGIDEATAAAAARRLAALIDPEDLAASAAAVPATLRFADIDRDAPDDDQAPDDDRWCDDAAAGRIVRRWRRAGPDPEPCTPIGVSADGLVDIDLVRDGPHGLIAGTTGSGKSELLRTLVLGLATRCSPDHLTFVLVDYKGGSTFDACARLPHTVGLVSDLDEGGAARALVSLEAELRRRERLLRLVGASDLTSYRARPDVAPLPRLAVVVDEFAALAQELPHFMASLVGVAQRGRSLGVHLLLATQRPAGVVSDDIRANTNLRLALRLHDTVDARDIVGDELPATLSRGQAGRAVLRLGPDELVVFQAARCTGVIAPSPLGLLVTRCRSAGASPGSSPPVPNGEPTELSVMVDSVCRAAERLGAPAPHRPWVEPLPTLLDPAEVDPVAGASAAGAAAHDAIGLVDDPRHQSRQTLRWDPASGNLGLIGALGSGVTTTLVGLATALCRTAPPDALHLYVIDAVGDPILASLGSIAHCGAVVGGRDIERLHRLLARLDVDLEQRRAGGAPGPRAVVMVDGYESLRASLSSIERVETLALLDRVTVDGPAAGVSWVVAGADLGRVECAERWVFRPPGPASAIHAAGRITIESSGLEGQVALGASGLAALPDRSDPRCPPPIDVLADRIARSTLAASWSSGAGARVTDHLVVGRSSGDLDTAALAVPAGDHVLVGGASGSGKSTALGVLAAAWRDLHPGGIVVAVDRRRPLDRDVIDAGRAALVVVDDADRVDDPVLAGLATDHRPGVTLLVAARMEAVRAAYGHWTREVARCRCGLVLTSSGEVDGELLGAALPRRTLIAPRPGLAWLIDPTGHRLAQVASPDD